MGIAKLGHVGIHCTDLETMKRFYRDLVGLTLTDEDPELGFVFFSARPDEEHHELLLCGGRTAPSGTLMVQQISFRCETLGDIIERYHRFTDHQVRFDMIVSHGNAVGIYFYDPEGNRCEVYWPTGLQARQPYLEAVDLTLPEATIMSQIRDSVAKHGATGIVDTSLLAAQDISAPS